MVNIKGGGLWRYQQITVCAFANDLDNWGGGYIVIGVEESNGCPVYLLKGVPADHIPHLRQWRKITKSVFIIFEKCRIQCNRQTMKKKILYL